MQVGAEFTDLIPKVMQTSPRFYIGIPNILDNSSLPHPDQRRPMGNSPVQITVNEPGLCCEQDDTMSWIDGASDTVRTTINLGVNLYAIAVNPVTNKVYITHLADGTVSVFDGDS